MYISKIISSGFLLEREMLEELCWVIAQFSLQNS